MLAQPLTHQACLPLAALSQTTLHIIITILGFSMTPQQQLHVHLHSRKAE
jgi:hypothetical protein